MAVFTIQSEQDIYQVLQNYLENPNYFHNTDIRFDLKEKLEFRLTGEAFHGSITPTVMKAFIELQNGLNRAYALALYGTANASLLTAQEREDLEFTVSVEKGSSLLSLEIGDPAEKLLTEAVSKMSGTEAAVIIIAIAAFWFGHSAFKYFLDYRKEKRTLEAKGEQDVKLIEHLSFASQQETERAKIMAQVAARQPLVASVKELANEAKTEAVKKLAQAETIEIDGNTFTGEQADALVKNTRKRSIEARLDGIYRILAVDSSSLDEFKVTVQARETGVRFTASVQDDSLENKYKKILQQNEWAKTPLFLEINASKRITDDSIIRATITRAENLPDDEEEG